MRNIYIFIHHNYGSTKKTTKFTTKKAKNESMNEEMNSVVSYEDI